MFRIVIDGSICSGFGDCADLAPDVFEVDSHGKALLRVGTTRGCHRKRDATPPRPGNAVVPATGEPMRGEPESNAS